jgi:hypothetical protein
VARFGVRVVGANRLARTLRAADMDVKVMSRINKQAASTVAAAARPTAPVGVKTRKSRKRYRPGKLAKTIRAGATLRAGVVRAGGGRVPYANVIHWGWPSRNIRARPWLSDAAVRTEPVWVKQYEQHMKDVVKQVKGA